MDADQAPEYVAHASYGDDANMNAFVESINSVINKQWSANKGQVEVVSVSIVEPYKSVILFRRVGNSEPQVRNS